MLWTVCGISCDSLEHQEGPFHIPCLSARKVLYANRSSVCNKLGVRPSGICIPSHPGREANPHSNSSSWGRRWMATIPLVGMNHFWRTWNTTGVNGETYSPSWKKVLIPCCHHPKGFDTVTWREIHAFFSASKEAIRAVPVWTQQRWSRKPFSFVQMV